MMKADVAKHLAKNSNGSELELTSVAEFNATCCETA